MHFAITKTAQWSNDFKPFSPRKGPGLCNGEQFVQPRIQKMPKEQLYAVLTFLVFVEEALAALKSLNY